MEEKDIRICPVCNKEVERNDMNFASFLFYYAGYNRGGHANITITYNKYIHSIQEEVRNGK